MPSTVQFHRVLGALSKRGFRTNRQEDKEDRWLPAQTPSDPERRYSARARVRLAGLDVTPQLKVACGSFDGDARECDHGHTNWC